MDQPTNQPSGKHQPENQESTPFEMPPDIKAPEAMGGPRLAGNQTPGSRGPMPPSPKSPLGLYLLMVLLVLILIGGIAFFVAWKGWISIPGLSNLLGKGGPTPKPSASLSSSPSLSPGISPLVSPQESSSPKITSNVNDETRKKDLATLQKGLGDYFAANSAYPISQTVIKTSDSQSALAAALAPKYLEKLPDDPLAPQFYYGYKSDGSSFELTAVLEDKTDPDGKMTGSVYLYIINSTNE